ncbi:MAG: signal peptidase I [Planctomycetes bacterium]|nr:signal peptidase I [Planctomycetota bacterium]
MSPKSGKKTVRKTPWRDNIEAFTVAIIMAVMLKYFVVEAYKIPTPSMQPTLMGDEGTGISDRILVDKLSFHFREPERYEVIVFKYPLNRAQNFIKRIVGMPGEDFRVWNGDLWSRKDASEPWKILRRPKGVQTETWKALQLSDDPRTGWTSEAKGWSSTGRTLSARGDGRAQFRIRGATNVVDDYTHGYNGKIAPLQRAPGNTARHNVGDLRVDGEVAALAGTTSVAVEFTEGPRTYVLEIPGPAADTNAAPRIRVRYGTSDVASAAKLATESVGSPYRLAAGKSMAFGAQNIDDMLSLEIDGETVCELEIAGAADNAATAWSGGANLTVAGAGADFTELQTRRDIYYTSEAKVTELTIPVGHYFMMGDNTQNSSDGREWTFERLSWPGEGSNGAIVRGNKRSTENPVQVMSDEGVMTTFFRDEWGELWNFPAQSSTKAMPESAPVVSRDLICGRAVFVFWPISPSYDAYRLKWVH